VKKTRLSACVSRERRNQIDDGSMQASIKPSRLLIKLSR
jgi:hypothetical protein